VLCGREREAGAVDAESCCSHRQLQAPGASLVAEFPLHKGRRAIKADFELRKVGAGRGYALGNTYFPMCLFKLKAR
jgi:hypothetical protein